MDSFNELTKNLRKNNSITTEAINSLAKKLIEKKIATTIIEAKEKAKTMLTTEKKAIKKSDKKLESTIYNDPRNNPNYNQYRQKNIEEIRKRALEGRPIIKIQTNFQTPGFEKKKAINNEEKINVKEYKKNNKIKNTEYDNPIVSKPIIKKEKEKKISKNPSIDINDIFNFSKK